MATIPEIPTMSRDTMVIKKDDLKTALTDLRDLFANPVTKDGEPLLVSESEAVTKSVVKSDYGSNTYIVDDLKNKLQAQAATKWEHSAANYIRKPLGQHLLGEYRSAIKKPNGSIDPASVSLSEIAAERDRAIHDRDSYKVGENPRGYYPLLAKDDPNPGKFIPPVLNVKDKDKDLLPIFPDLSSPGKYRLNENTKQEYYAIQDEYAIIRLAKLKYILAADDAVKIAFKTKQSDFLNFYREMQIKDQNPIMDEVNWAREQYRWDHDLRPLGLYFTGYYHEYVRDAEGNLKYPAFASHVWADNKIPEKFHKSTATVTTSAPSSSARKGRTKSRRSVYSRLRSTRKARK